MLNKIAIVGEAWGEAEEQQQTPFVGASGWHLTQMLTEAGIDRGQCFLTNVFNLRPKPSNDIKNLCSTKSEDTGKLPALATGKYLRGEFIPEIQRLYKELAEVRPNIIILLGGTATWAVLGGGAISKVRGTVAAAKPHLAIAGAAAVEGIKCLPTYHPAGILREWKNRHVTVLDLMKARREAEFPDIRRPQREIWVEPSLADMELFYDQYLAEADIISYDIETVGDQITCIGFAATSDRAIVIPITDNRKAGGSYWPTLEEELAAWNFVRRVLRNKSRKLAQNGLYDINFLWRGYGMTVPNSCEDTMLLHHALMPESVKGLGFLGSVYTNEPAWKTMRPKGKHTIKRDE